MHQKLTSVSVTNMLLSTLNESRGSQFHPFFFPFFFDLRHNFPGNLAVIYLKFDSSAPCEDVGLLNRDEGGGGGGQRVAEMEKKVILRI